MPLINLALSFLLAHWKDCIDVAVALIVAVAGNKMIQHYNTELVRKAVQGAYVVVAQIAQHTPMTWDDVVAEVLKRAALELNKEELKAKDAEKAKAITRSMQADPSFPTIPGVLPPTRLSDPKKAVGRQP